MPIPSREENEQVRDEDKKPPEIAASFSGLWISPPWGLVTQRIPMAGIPKGNRKAEHSTMTLQVEVRCRTR